MSTELQGALAAWLVATVLYAFVMSFWLALILRLAVKWVAKDVPARPYWHHYWTCVIGILAASAVGLAIGFTVGIAGLYSSENAAAWNIVSWASGMLCLLGTITARLKVDPARGALVLLIMLGVNAALWVAVVVLIFGFTLVLAK